MQYNLNDSRQYEMLIELNFQELRIFQLKHKKWDFIFQFCLLIENMGCVPKKLSKKRNSIQVDFLKNFLM